MKQIIHKTLGIAIIAFFSQAAMATDVTSTFTTGATLTAAQMTEIKDAVNSKQDISSGTPVYTVVVFSSNITTGNFGCQQALCPTAHPKAIGGGVDLFNVFSMYVTASGPLIDISGTNTRTLSVSAGTYTNATKGWQACARNDSGSSANFAVSVICTD